MRMGRIECDYFRYLRLPVRPTPLLMAVTLAFFSAPHCSRAHGQSTKAPGPDTAAIRDFYRAGVERNGIVGSTLVLVDHGRVVLNETYGDQRLTPQQPV